MPTDPLAKIVEAAYSRRPSSLLYHYTSLEGVLAIVPSGQLWATDIHYLNDASELREAAAVFELATSEIPRNNEEDREILRQLVDWLRNRLSDGHLLFVACFSEDGNLLSQWRGYTPHGKGLSLGFSHAHLAACAARQGFLLGQCVYGVAAQAEVAKSTVAAIVGAARLDGPSLAAHPSQSYHPTFLRLEANLLRIAALFKSAAFEAEREWRVVSPAVANYRDSDIQYRTGRTTLLPYVNFLVSAEDEQPARVAHVFLGPTPNNNLAMQSLSMFLSRERATPSGGIQASGIPYRET
jgi:hypothetical protein